MSKILNALRKEAGRNLDLGYQLSTLDGVQLFPPPPPEQLTELEQLANALISRHDKVTGQTLVFASTTGSEGASYVSYNVARHLSFLLDRRVAWVDANLRSPQPSLMGQEPSFRTLLSDPHRFAELKLGGDFVVIGHGDRSIKATDLLNSQNYLTLLEMFSRNFFFTIIDAPPILVSADTAHMSEAATGVVVVVESRRLKYEVVQHGIDKLRSQNVNVIGTVLNKRVFDIPSFLYRRL